MSGLPKGADSKNTHQSALRLAYNAQPDLLIALDVMGILNNETDRRESIKAGMVEPLAKSAKELKW